jgi:hypothetical protein
MVSAFMTLIRPAALSRKKARPAIANDMRSTSQISRANHLIRPTTLTSSAERS